MQEALMDNMLQQHGRSCPFLFLHVRRDHLIEDSLNQVTTLCSPSDASPGLL